MAVRLLRLHRSALPELEPQIVYGRNRDYVATGRLPAGQFVVAGVRGNGLQCCVEMLLVQPDAFMARAYVLTAKTYLSQSRRILGARYQSRQGDEARTPNEGKERMEAGGSIALLRAPSQLNPPARCICVNNTLSPTSITTSPLRARPQRSSPCVPPRFDSSLAIPSIADRRRLDHSHASSTPVAFLT